MRGTRKHDAQCGIHSPRVPSHAAVAALCADFTEGLRLNGSCVRKEAQYSKVRYRRLPGGYRPKMDRSAESRLIPPKSALTHDLRICHHSRSLFPRIGPTMKYS